MKISVVSTFATLLAVSSGGVWGKLLGAGGGKDDVITVDHDGLIAGDGAVGGGTSDSEVQMAEEPGLLGLAHVPDETSGVEYSDNEASFRLRATAALDAITSKAANMHLKGGTKQDQTQAGAQVLQDSVSLLKEMKAEAEPRVPKLANMEDPNNEWAHQLLLAYQTSLSQISKSLELLPKIIDFMNKETPNATSAAGPSGDNRAGAKSNRRRSLQTQATNSKDTEDDANGSNAGTEDGFCRPNDLHGHREARKHRRKQRRHFEGNPHARHHFDRMAKLQDALHSGDYNQAHQHLPSSHAYMPKQKFGRRLSQSQDDAQAKANQCRILMGCVSQMSIYDMMLYFYSDDINPNSGEIDDNVYTMDKAPNLYDVYNNSHVQQARNVENLKDKNLNYFMTREDWCDQTLQLFHRDVEFDDIPHWEGATVSEVCLAEGGHTYVKLDQIASKVGLQVAEEVSKDMFECSKDLYNSDANTPRVSPFAFSRDDPIDIDDSTSFVDDGAKTNEAIPNMLDHSRDTAWTSTLGAEGMIINQGLCMRVQADDQTVRSHDNPNAGSFRNLFHYSSETDQIRFWVNSNNFKCLQVLTDSNNEVGLRQCGADNEKQKWVLDKNLMLRSYWNPSKCIELESGGANKKYTMQNCDASKERQRFNIEANFFPLQDSVMMFLDGECLELDSNGVDVASGTCQRGTRQRWYYDPTTTGIKSMDNDMCLEKQSNDAVKAKRCDGSDAQTWGQHDDKIMGGGNQCITRISGGMEMQTCAPAKDENQKIFYARSMFGAAGNKEVNFLLNFALDDDFFGSTAQAGRISVENECMSVADDGSSVETSRCRGRDNQVWEYEPTTQQLKNKDSGKCLKAHTSGTVLVVDCRSQNNQKWTQNHNAHMKALDDDTRCLQRHNTGRLEMASCVNTATNQIFSSFYSVDSIQFNWARNSHGEFKKCKRRDIKMYGSDNEQIYFAWTDAVTFRWNENTNQNGAYTSEELLSETAFISSNAAPSTRITIRCTRPTAQISLHSIKAFGTKEFPGISPARGLFEGDYETDFHVPSGIETSLSRDEFGQLHGASEVLYKYRSENLVAAIQSSRHIMAGIYFRIWAYWLRPELWIGVGNDYLREELRNVLEDPRHPHPENHGNEDYPLDQAYGSLNSYTQADYYSQMLKYSEENTVIKDEMVKAYARFYGRAFDTDDDMDDREEEFDTFNEKSNSYYGAIQRGFNLVFGKDASVGYVCGIAGAVAREVARGGNGADKFPGQCCLDAPFENEGDHWGRKYDCSEPCQTMGPFFSGLSEESCSTAGGTFCPSAVNCTELQICVDSEIVDANATNRSAYVAYLQPGVVSDPTDHQSCADSRQYFGFDPLYENDADICDNIKQLHNTRHFEFLDEFYEQGSPRVSPSPFGQRGYGGQGYSHDQIADEQWDPLTQVDTTEEGKWAVQAGPEMAIALFALAEIKAIVDFSKAFVGDWECPKDAVSGNTCTWIKNAVYFKVHVLHVVLELAYNAFEFTIGWTSEVTNIQTIQDWQALQALPQQNDEIYDKLRTTFEAVVKQDSNLESLGNVLVGNNGNKGKIRDILDDLGDVKTNLLGANGDQDRIQDILTNLLGANGDQDRIQDILTDLSLIKSNLGITRTRSRLLEDSPSEKREAKLDPHTFELKAEVVTHTPKQFVVMTTLNGAAADYKSISVKALGGSDGLAHAPHTVIGLEEGTVLFMVDSSASVFKIQATYSHGDAGDEYRQSALLSFGVDCARQQ